MKWFSNRSRLAIAATLVLLGGCGGAVEEKDTAEVIKAESAQPATPPTTPTPDVAPSKEIRKD